MSWPQEASERASKQAPNAELFICHSSIPYHLPYRSSHLLTEISRPRRLNPLFTMPYAIPSSCSIDSALASGDASTPGQLPPPISGSCPPPRRGQGGGGEVRVWGRGDSGATGFKYRPLIPRRLLLRILLFGLDTDQAAAKVPQDMLHLGPHW